MHLRLMLFVDFWNFQLNWNDRTSRALCDWNKAPVVFSQQGGHLLNSSGSAASFAFHEIRVYVSFDPSNENDRKLRGWLNTFLDRQPGFRVFTRERKARPKPIRCPACGNELINCPNCSQPFRHSAEKGVDAAIVTDLLSLAWEGAYDIAILVTSDADFVPVVERLQEKGLKVINASWRGYGHQLARVCWASFLIDDLVPLLIRE